MADLTRKELAALNNTVALLRADAETNGRTLAEEIAARTEVELAAFFIGFQAAEVAGHRGEQRQQTAREVAAAAIEGAQGEISPDAASEFRSILTYWVGQA
ncbi:hypothetical protein ACFQ7N_40650 [Streptomyces niveus]|uniref:hypothetical protein n=1 Tax=Streptomyces niveus TaxID=193462 RepID=UPI00367B4A53